MLILSQNKENLHTLETAHSIRYEFCIADEPANRKSESNPKYIHKIVIRGPWTETLGKYETKERCLEIIRDVCRAYEDSCRTVLNFDHAAMVERPYTIIRNTVYEMPEV